jgi:SAM-dependent methyltransferase
MSDAPSPGDVASSAMADPTTRARLSALAHTTHPVAAPLSDATVAALLAALEVPPEGRVVDLGCGAGEWLARLRGRVACAVTGVDEAPPALEAARARLDDPDPPEAGAVGVGRPVDLVRADAATWAEEARLAGRTYDAALCVGSTHALGGLLRTLDTVAGLVAPGGRALVGDGFWEAEPTPPALDALGAARDDLLDLAGTTAAARAAGLRVHEVVTSTPEEWDAYERAWCGALEAFADTCPGDPLAAAARAVAAAHRDGYVHGYRGVLGFTVLVVARP